MGGGVLVLVVGRSTSPQEQAMRGLKRAAFNVLPHLCLEEAYGLFPAVAHSECGLDHGVAGEPPAGSEVPGILVRFIQLAVWIAAVRTVTGDEIKPLAAEEGVRDARAQHPMRFFLPRSRPGSSVQGGRCRGAGYTQLARMPGARRRVVSMR